MAQPFITWDDNWNNVIRYLFSDIELKKLMRIPEKRFDNIVDFRDRYFVAGESSDAIVIDEDVRLVYYMTNSPNQIGKNAYKKYLEIDIYVKKDHLYDVRPDRLKRRDKAIFERLKHLLTGTKYVCRMAYRYADDYDASTRTIGYKRYHVVFSYNITT